MSEFPKSGLGSWAQWRRRVRKMQSADLAVDGPEDARDEWVEEHTAHLGLKYLYDVVDSDRGTAERHIADRKAG